MSTQSRARQQLSINSQFAVQFLGFLVMAHGAYILADSLLDLVAYHRTAMLTDLSFDVPLLIGVSLIYLGSLLRRRKRTAWLVTVGAYLFYLGTEITQLLYRISLNEASFEEIMRALVLPLSVLILLFIFRRQFVVKSDIQGFRFASRTSVIILLVALVYGVAGFLLLDKSDFHREIGFPTAVHYTVDQFNVTTTEPLQPYTRRAHLFVDSLSFVSLAAIAYVAISLFQPLKQRLSDQHMERDQMTRLLRDYGAPSEEFFKLWPHDKHYFFTDNGRAGLAFHVSRGVALIVSDPVGEQKNFKGLLDNFNHLCFGNDWLPALVHVSDEHHALYEKQGFELQKLGQEAILNLEHFQTKVASQKYFRQIGNKFTKHGYSCELLQPPHHQAVIDRLKDISDQWLSQGNRAERGFIMGNFSPDYMQLCQLMVARDAAGTIQAFITLVPAQNFDKQEATYDLLRQANKALGNVNDFVLMNLIAELHQQGYKRLNLGLCPLAGLEDSEDENNRLVDRVFRFAYANGDRFYSFSGLHRFKAKYEPEWHDRYIAYKGGLRGFSRTITALMRAMKV